MSGVVLVSEDRTRILCHECGRMFKNVASHSSQAHGIFKREYKDRHGLFSKEILVAPETRKIINTPNIAELGRKSQARESVEHRESRLANARSKRKAARLGRTKPQSRNQYQTCDVQIPERIRKQAQQQQVKVAMLSSESPTPRTLIASAIKYFGSWTAAKAVACQSTPNECNANLRWSSQAHVLFAFRAYHAIHGEYPYVSDLCRQKGLPTVYVLRRQFGSYSLNAVKTKLGWPVNLPGHRRKS